MRKYNLIIYFILIYCLFCVQIEAKKETDNSEVRTMEELKTLFMNPPVEYRSAPLWVWNDDVTKEQIDEQLADFKSMGMGGVFIHPRPGLITSYLSEEWFSLCGYTVKRGKELGMNVWLYDENSYPSGFAGGHVPAKMPESYNQGQGLALERVDKLPEDVNSFYLVLKKTDSKFIDVTKELNAESNKKGDYFLFEKKYYEKLPWHGGYSYVDLLVEGVTEKFIELTMTGYQKHIGSEFGKVVPGIFTDEPNISSPGGIRWTPSLFVEFEKRWGYDLKTNLPSLVYELGNWKQVRHNYYTTLLEMFIERWSKPWYKYTEKNNLDWTGHYWEHGWPDPHHGSDNMAMYAYHQMPAIDILMNQYSEDVNAQFGNVRAVKELSSVANQLGRTRTLSETYGAGGWELSLEDMKRIGDWEYVLGVNFMNQHLSYMTLEGARKRDHPQSFSYHAPWWKHYRIMGDYFARLSLALSSGKQNNRVLVFEPTSTGWLYYSPTESNEKLSELGPLFQEFIMNLEKYQIEYDLASENIVKDNGKIDKNKFIVGEREYDIVIFPPGYENLDTSTLELIKKYLSRGGKVISFNNIPEYIDGNKSNELETVVSNHPKNWKNVNSLNDSEVLEAINSEKIKFIHPEKINGKLFHHRRDLEDGQLVFLVNTSNNEWSAGSFFVTGESVYELDLESGELKSFPYEIKSGSLEIAFDLPPAGSLLLSIDNESKNIIQDNRVSKINIITSLDDVKIKNVSKNVLTIDYCDIKIGEKEEKDIYCFDASEKIFNYYGLNGNPWREAVQYKNSIVELNNFDKNSGFEADYSFNIEKGVDTESLQAVVEHPELWKIQINGKTALADPSSNWLDRKFGVYNIGKNVKVGMNKLKIMASPMSVHSELEPIYIRGDFKLESIKKGWNLVKEEPLKLGSWKEQGFPFYSESVSYTKSYNIIKKDKRFVLKLTNWKGSVAEIKVNNKHAGIIAWPPYELDITNQINEGSNKIRVDVTGTLKNLLGPHHIGPVRGTAWPASFATASKSMPSGNEYDFIDYGLFEEFMIIESDGPPQKVYWKLEHVSKPIFGTEDTISFNSPIYVSLSSPTEGAKIHYTLDGSDPDEYSNVYSKPIKIVNSTIIKAKSFKLDAVPSSIAQRNFYILDENKNGLEYSYYEGDWLKLPDFKSIKEIKNGHVYAFNLNSFKRRSAKFAIEFRGYFQIESAGEFNFYTVSNDGSKLFIGDKLIVNNDGIHGNFEGQGKIYLKKGVYPIKLQYFDAGGSQSLKVLYSKEGGKREIIPLDKLTREYN